MTASNYELMRRPVPPQLWGRLALTWVIVAILFIVAGAGSIIHTRFPDPDDTLRLVQVRDLLAGQGWYDLVQHRLNAPGGGVPMHWSRLVDIPIAAAILLVKPFFGQWAGEEFALIFVPLATFGAALVLLARIAWRFFDQERTIFVCLTLALAVPAVAQMRPMRIDHHGWQIVCALLALNGLLARSPKLGGWIVGLALATWLSISIEGLPMAVAICGIVALRWLRHENGAAWLAATMQSLAVFSVALFAATRGTADIAEHCDAISPVHLAVFICAAIGVTGLVRIKRPSAIVWGMGLGILAALLVALVRLAAPQCTTGAFVGLDPLVDHFWYERVKEGLPIYRQDWQTIAQIALPGLIGLWASYRLLLRSTREAREWWMEFILLLLAALAVSVMVARAASILTAFAALPIGWLVREWLNALRSETRVAHRVLASCAIALALVPATPFIIAGLFQPAHAKTPGEARLAQVSYTNAVVSDCDIADGAKMLNRLPRGEILAPLDIGPELLYRTNQTVVASGHHRGAKAMHLVIATFLASPDEAHRALVARGTRYVAICPDLNEPMLYLGGNPHGLMADLLAERAPKWLEPVRVHNDGSLEVWRIIR